MFSKLDYVYAVYKHKSFSKAARSLFISQPSLSAAIQKIEAKVGAPIFARNGHTITLTDIGEEYIRTVETILGAQNDFKRRFDDIYSLDHGKILIGGSNYLCSYIIPNIINEFTLKHPNIELSLDEAKSISLVENLYAEKIDILIDSFDIPDEGLNAFPIKEERIVLGVPSDWPINDELKEYQIPFGENQLLLDENILTVSVNKFKSSNFILLKDGNDMHKRATKIFAEGKINPRVSFYADQLNISYALAESGLGACFVTDTIVNCSPRSQKLTFYAIKSKYNTRCLYVAYKKGRYCTKAMKEFIDVVLDSFKG